MAKQRRRRQRNKTNSAPFITSEPTPGNAADEQPAPDPGSRVRAWASRLVAATVVPLLLLAGLELGLRLGGVGFPTAFFVPVPGSNDLLTPNQCFGWRFFPRQVARNPVPAVVSRHKPQGVIRLFVLGGSAALGTPDAAYSASRALQVLLEQAYPDQRFEVINAAMTAISSHVVREIAADCCSLEPDLLVVYLGNNEVVGPYGPGTVFGPLARQLTLTRLGIKARTLRLGQVVDGAIGRLAADEPQRAAWKGMEMFIGRRVAHDDPRLTVVAHHLRQNLEAMIKLAAGAGAGVVLSTVATNLADCPPFASLQQQKLSDQQRQTVQQSLEAGLEQLRTGEPALAMRSFTAAVQADHGNAELHYHLATALRALGQHEAALQQFIYARDLDALRFRADSTINQVIREVAASGTGPVSLVDGERALQQAPETVNGVLGDELLYEHVHLKLIGSYRLAVALADEVVRRLGSRLGPRTGGPAWISAERCAELLGYSDWDRVNMLAEITAMTSRPPFTGQYDHGSRLRRRRLQLRQLRLGLRGRLAEAEQRHRQALANRPDDLLLRLRLAELLQDRQDWQGAAAVWRWLLGRVPDNPVWHTDLGFTLLDAGKPAQAVAELRTALRLRPELADTHINLALALQRQGQPAAAEEMLHAALAISPASEAARLNLASLLVAQERYDEAEQLYRDLLRDNPRSAEAHFGRGVLLEQRQQREAAVVAYRRAVELDPDLAKAGNNLGHLLLQLDRVAEAEQVLQRTCELSPDYALAHFNLADLLLSHGRPAEAIPSYRNGLAEQPQNHAARVNLAVALQLVGRSKEAGGQYQTIIAAEPEHVRALIGYAWLLATSDDPLVQDRAEAVRLGEQAMQLSKGLDPAILESMAVIYEAAGQPEQAQPLRDRLRHLPRR